MSRRESRPRWQFCPDRGFPGSCSMFPEGLTERVLHVCSCPGGGSSEEPTSVIHRTGIRVVSVEYLGRSRRFPSTRVDFRVGGRVQDPP